MTMKAEAESFSGRAWLVLVGNVESTAGGSMCLAPGARLDDGELNISLFPHGSRIRMGLKLMPKIGTGEHVTVPEVSYFPGKRVEIDSDPPAVVELDGDLYGLTPVVFTVCPQAMNILTPNN
jgi:diacylglycerol kinase (ATP)